MGAAGETGSTEAALCALVGELLEAPNAFYAPRLEAAGLGDAGAVTVESFVGNCPFTTKAEISADQLAHPPFGSNLTRPIDHFPRVCQTSGTTGDPLSWPDTERNWSAMLDAWEMIYRAAGIRPGRDRIYFAFSFGPFLGFWTAFEAAARMGCMAIPGGGLGSAGRLAAMERLGATTLCCTPTYAIRLGEHLREQKGAGLGVARLIVAGEPGGSVREVRGRIRELWGGAEVIDHHGMTEVGPASFEPPGSPGNLCLLPGFHLGEVVDAKTGREVGEGEEGELVLTTLRRNDSPLLRYRTGDLVRKRMFDVGGEATLGFEGGILGRADDMVVVRGVNIYPSAVDAVLARFPEIGEYQVQVTSERAMAELLLKVELKPGAAADTAGGVAAALQEAFSMRLPVEAVAAGSLPRSEFKARRWVTR